MAMIECKECGNQVSSKSPKCPNCGIDLQTAKKLKGCLVIFIVMFFIAYMGMDSSRSPTTPNSEPPPDNELLIKRSDFGDKWPFTANQGILKCEGYKIILIEINGIGYALNGNARSFANKYNLREIDEIWLDDPQWKDEPLMAGIKVNVGPLIDRGLELCK